MDKQKLIIFAFFAILFPFFGLSGEKSDETGSSKIALEGEFKKGGFRSGGDDITAEIQGNVIMASFHRDLGDIMVALSNDMGVPVYEGTVNTTRQAQVFISLSGLPSGMYTITFSNGLGAMYGDFEI